MRLHSAALRLTTVAVGATILVTPLRLVSGQNVEKTTDFKWSDQISSGHWVRISNLNGKVTVGQATGDRVEVTAVKRWTRGNPDDVRILAHKDGDDVVVCALWDKRDDCDDSSRRGRRHDYDYDDSDDISVDFTVLIPKGTKLNSATVNGGASITGVTGEVEVSAVNGGIRVESGGGPISASSVNGRISARITGASADAAMSFSTVNGGVLVEVPDDFGADVTMTSVNGGLESDFPMTLRGRIDPHRLSAHVGAPGGPRITVTTVNGGIELRKR